MKLNIRLLQLSIRLQLWERLNLRRPLKQNHDEIYFPSGSLESRPNLFEGISIIKMYDLRLKSKIRLISCKTLVTRFCFCRFLPNLGQLSIRHFIT